MPSGSTCFENKIQIIIIVCKNTENHKRSSRPDGVGIKSTNPRTSAIAPTFLTSIPITGINGLDLKVGQQKKIITSYDQLLLKKLKICIYKTNNLEYIY